MTDNKIDNAPSNGTVELTVSYKGSTKTNIFTKKQYTMKGQLLHLCKSLQSERNNSQDITIRYAKIRQTEGNDGWGLKELLIQRYPGSKDYDPYSMNFKDKRIWTDGNSDCPRDLKKENCCTNRRSCRLYIIECKYIKLK